MTKKLNLKITSPCTQEFPYQKAFPAEMPLIEFKRRIELVVGIYAANMSLTLLNEQNKFVGELRQESQTLQELGVCDNFTVKVEDKSGQFLDPLSGHVEHYKINEENYQQREENFFNFKKRNIPAHIAVGNRCTVISKLKGDRSGTIAFVGEVDFKPDEVMVGVVLDQPLGKHDGLVDGKRYFQCEPLCGIFVERKFVKPEIQASSASNKNTGVETVEEL